MKNFLSLVLVLFSALAFGQQVNKPAGGLPQTGPTTDFNFIGSTGTVLRSTRQMNESNVVEALAAQPNWASKIIPTAQALTNILYQQVDTNVFSASGIAHLQSLLSSATTGTNATFWLTSSGFFNIISTNGIVLGSVSNGVITFNTNVIINGTLTVNSTTNTDTLSNLVVTGWALLKGPETNSTITGPGLLGIDVNGARSAVTVGSGLSLSGGSLTATGGGGSTTNSIYGGTFGTNLSTGQTIIDAQGNLTHYTTNAPLFMVYDANTNVMFAAYGTNNFISHYGTIYSTSSSTNNTNGFYILGGTTNFFQGLIQNTNPVGSADLVVAADNGNDSQYYADFGVNNSKYAFAGPMLVGATNDGYFYFLGSPTNGGPGTNFWIGNLTTNGLLQFFTVSSAGIQTNITVTTNQVIVRVNSTLNTEAAASFAGVTNRGFAAYGLVTNDANGKTYTSPNLLNNLLPNPLIAPGPIAGTQITNTSFSVIGVVTNDANGKTYTTPTLPTSLLGGVGFAMGGSSGPITVPISGTYFMAPNNSFTNYAADASGITRMVLPCAGQVLGIYAVASANPGAVVNTLTVMTNGVATGAVATLNNVTAANDTAHPSIVMLAGTEIGVKLVTGAGTAVKWGWGIMFRATSGF